MEECTPEAVAEAPAQKVKKPRKIGKPKKPAVIKVKKPAGPLYPERFGTLEPPQSLYRNRRIGDCEVEDKWGNKSTGVLHLAGVGSTSAQVVFISPCTLREEEFEGRSGLKPQMLKGPFGALFKRNLNRVGFAAGDWFYTAMCKYHIQGNKPKAEDLRWNRFSMVDELRTIKPKIIVALGKQVFDQFTELRCKLGDIQGGFFRSEEFDCLLYPMDTILTPMQRPEHLERFVSDLRQVKTALDETRGIRQVKLATSYHVLDDLEKIGNWTNERLEKVPSNMAVDCEWHGRTFVGGQLRSVQASWALGHAAYLRLRDEQNQECLKLADVGEIIRPLFNHPKLKFVGHNFFADALWLRNHLGILTDGRCSFDTLFAQHTLDESADLKLERMAVRYTDMGRYDIPLLLWKKANKFDEEHEVGYGRVPDKVLIDYACLDGASGVQLADGSWRRIDALVRSRYAGKVKALLDDRVVDCRVINWHRAAVRQKAWFKLFTASTSAGRWDNYGPAFTPDHEVITQRGKVRVDQLLAGSDAIATEEREFTADQLSVYLGCRLGDGGLARKNGKGVGFCISQCLERSAYLAWKASVFESHGMVQLPTVGNQARYATKFKRYLTWLDKAYPSHDRARHSKCKLKITNKVLNALGMLGLAVWYQDDGTLPKSGGARIYCVRKDPAEINIAVQWLRDRFGPTVVYNSNNRFIQISGWAKVKFLEAVSPYMHKAVAYKSDRSVGPIRDIATHGALFYEVIEAIRPYARTTGHRGGGVRYCLTVERAGNFLTRVGFVSNCRDADATMRLFPILASRLLKTRQWDYYTKIALPFVTDGFVELVETGFPMNRERMEEMRKVFTRNQVILIKDFQTEVDVEAEQFLRDCLTRNTGSDELFHDLRSLRDSHYQSGAGPVMESVDFDEALNLVKSVIDHEQLRDQLEFFLHWWSAPGFNINSTDHLRRWLFAVKGMTPLKTTKRDGFQTSWERVAALPKIKQAEYTPATDKQTLKLFAEKDKLVARVQELKGVANIVKAFLKGPDEEGREQGLMAWIQEDGRIHPNYALTETARPRSWSPNVLNWTKNVTKPIEAAFKRANAVAMREHYFHIRKEAQGFADLLQQLRAVRQAPVSIRSFVQAPPGWCIVDMDFKTAEVVQLGYVAGDSNLIEVLTSPDPQFARVDPKSPKKAVRIAYNNISSYPDEAKDPTLIKLDDPRIMRNPDGSIIHPLRDLHWELGETVFGLPRERLDEELARGVGKVGNFCLCEGSEVLTDRGLVPIEQVSICDKLWDGVEWVTHDGVVCNGEQIVHFYQGLWATDNHEVWTSCGYKVLFGQARAQRLELVRVAGPGSQTSGVKPDSFSSYGAEGRVARVYDILNAGPRHRFVCSGVLVSNSVPYGATDKLLERMVEVNTGRKPDEGTGAKIIESYSTRYAIAWRFLEQMEALVESPGWIRATSGRVRHFSYHKIVDVSGLSEYARNGILSPLKRQARNYQIQEGVAATAARATEMFLAGRRKNNLDARLFCLLYDAMSILAPLEQARAAATLLKECMTTRNIWENHGRKWHHEVDVSYGFRWGCKPTKQEKELLANYV